MRRLRAVFICTVASFTLFSASSVYSAEVNSSVKGATGNPISTIATWSGNGQFGNSNGATSEVMYRAPQGIIVAADGSILIADTLNHLIRQLKGNQVTTFAGLTLNLDEKGLPEGGISDGKKDKSVFQNPKGLATDANGNLFIADNSNNAIRKIDKAGNVTTFAGNVEGLQGSADGKGQLASFNHPSDVVVAANGRMYVADTLNHAIRTISPEGVVSTLNATSNRSVVITGGQADLAGDYKDGKLSEALFNEPTSIALDAKGNLYVSDTGNQRIRYIDLAAGMVTTVAGSKEVDLVSTEYYAEAGFEDGAAGKTQFNFPKGLALSAEGGLYIADSQNNAIRYLFNNRVSTVAGDALGTFGDQDGTERYTVLTNPTDVAVNSAGDLFIADSYNNKIKKASFYQLPASLKNDGSIHVVNGSTEVTFDAKTQNIKGRVMVPIRAITEALGYKVVPVSSTVMSLTKGTTTIELTIGNESVKTTIDGVVTTSKMDTVPFITDLHTYVPVRFLSEQLGKQVDWTGEYQTVILR
ncbi:MAG: stalk domain-containing protein [Paenibacillaceae bacterium]